MAYRESAEHPEARRPAERCRRKDHPRIKIWADYRFLDHLLVTVGADDLVNDPFTDPNNRTRITSGRDYFVGAGVFFTDDDIKLLIAALPIKF